MVDKDLQMQIMVKMAVLQVQNCVYVAGQVGTRVLLEG